MAGAERWAHLGLRCVAARGSDLGAEVTFSFKSFSGAVRGAGRAAPQAGLGFERRAEENGSVSHSFCI